MSFDKIFDITAGVYFYLLYLVICTWYVCLIWRMPLFFVTVERSGGIPSFSSFFFFFWSGKSSLNSETGGVAYPCIRPIRALYLSLACDDPDPQCWRRLSQVGSGKVYIGLS